MIPAAPSTRPAFRGPLDRRVGRRLLVLMIAIAAGAMLSVAAADWIAGVAVVVLWFVWRFLPKNEGPPVMQLALTFQWLQVTVGILYFAMTGRRIEEMDSDFRPVVLMGLGCVVALTVGLRLGSLAVRTEPEVLSRNPALPLGWKGLALLYVVSALLTGALQAIAWQYSGLTQAIFALALVRLCVLFLVFRRLCSPTQRFKWIAAVLVVEVAFGFTGYFAGFREPLLLALLAVLEVFDGRKRSHLVALGGLAGAALFFGFLWLGIRTEYRGDISRSETIANSRTDRAERIAELTAEWATRGLSDRLANLDFFVSRMWAVYYPALAIDQVPSLVPHENGALLWGTLKHVLMPRFFFPDKPPVISNSALVRRYSGVWVAGEEEGTSIAFGYLAESYIDFGVPWMFLPILLFGVLVGAALRGFLNLIRCREAGIVLVTVLGWTTLYLFERSWTKMLGDTLTYMIFLGGAVFLVDRLILSPRRRRRSVSASLTQYARPAR